MQIVHLGGGEQPGARARGPRVQGAQRTQQVQGYGAEDCQRRGG